MSKNNESKPQEENKPQLIKTIGKTTYLVNCHFSETSRETVQDKIKRMMMRDIENGDY